MTSGGSDKPDCDGNLQMTLADCMSCSRRHAEEESYYVASTLGFPRHEAKEFSLAVTRRIGRSFPALTMLELFLTDHCNLACSYCFVEGKHLQGHMSLDTAREAMSFFIRESKGESNLNLILLGGEPLVRFDLLESFLPWAKSEVNKAGKQLRIDMTSNGTLLDEERAAFLKRMGVMVLLSMDGDRETHDRSRVDRSGNGSFSRTLRGLENLRRTQGYVGVKMTVIPEEVANLVENVCRLTRRGVHHFLLGHATGIDWTLEQSEELCEAYLDIYDWWSKLSQDRRPKISMIENAIGNRKGSPQPSRHSYGCRAGRQSLMVAPDGGLFPCAKTYGVERMRDFFLLGTLKAGVTNQELRSQLTGRIAVERQACWECALQRKCFAGCIAVNAAMTGDAFEQAPSECRGQALHLQLNAVIRKLHQHANNEVDT